MEASQEESYRDSPPSSRSSSPTISAPATVKPLPAVPSTPPPPFEEPYRDDPGASSNSTPSLAPSRSRRYHQHHHSPAEALVYFEPYSDTPASGRDSDDVPLAHLHPYPTDAPPAYHIAVRQSYRDTLIAHIPINPRASADIDEEAQVDNDQRDELKDTIEKVVASLIVAIVLLMFAAFMGWWVVRYWL